MDKKRVLKVSWRILLAGMSIFTVLFCLDIKLVVAGINIFVMDVLAAGIWAFARLCRWAGRENTGKRFFAVVATTLTGLLMVTVLLVGLGINGGWYEYAEGTEPQTHRTFVAEYEQNLMGRGSVKLYERFGPLLLACDVDKYVGEFSLERPEDRQIYVSEDGKSIVVAYFFHVPIFIIPLEKPVEQAKTPLQALLEDQLVDDTHDAFLIDTGGELGTLLVTAELDEEAPTEDCRATVRFTVWNPNAMKEPLQTIMAGTNIFLDWSIIDANFDGYSDFACTYLRGNQPYYDHLWIWNEYHRRFENIPEYDKISAPTLDAGTGTVYGFNRSSAGGTGEHTFHQWEDWNHLVCMRQIELYQAGQSGTVRMSVRDRVAGELAEIYHEDFPSESSGWLDAQMAWHDLDYHGEPGGLYDLFQQQPIDNTRDAFLVSTGGRLGTLLVTAELAEERKGVFGARDITFSVWDPTEMEQPIQTFSEEFMMGVAPEFHHAADANFDGFQDFGYLYCAGNQPNYWHWWLWNEEQGQFEYYAPLTEVSQPVFDAEQQVVTGWARNSAASGVHTIYRWLNGELTLLRRIEKHYPTDDNTQLATVEDWIDGQMVVVYRKEWDLTTIKEGTPLVDWDWYDLDYHGDPY